MKHAQQRQMYKSIISTKERYNRMRIQYNAYLARMNAIRLAQTKPVKPRSTKNAVLVGINYLGTSNELYGCINDVNSMKTRLELTGFQCNTLTDTTVVKPTRSNILNAFKTLLTESIAGDQLFFLYSGHGLNVKDRNRDEADGMDEALVSADMQCIVDDELKSLLLQHLKKDVTLVAMFDSCHSGTVLDLKYQYMDSLSGDADKVYPTHLETAGKVFMISGCMDSQTSADAFIQNKSQGAMTWSLLESLKTVHSSTWRQLIQSMRGLLRQNGYNQIPQFSSGTLVDIDTRVFI